MSKRSKTSGATRDYVKVKGFLRLNIMNDDGSLAGDSGWIENSITNYGYETGIVGSFGKIAGSLQAGSLALGTGSAPNVASSQLPNELTDAAACRFAITPSAVSSKTLRMLGTLASNIITASRAISNIGVYGVSSVTLGSVFAGTTYTSSALATNQSVNCTYDIIFS